MKLDFDTEFTGLHQRTSLISLGIISEDGRTFYAELTDYKKSQVTPWIRKNVIAHLCLDEEADWSEDKSYTGEGVAVRGDTEQVRLALLEWLEQFDDVEFWSDCLSWDWVLLNELLADFSSGYPQLPDNVFYLPFDILPLYRAAGIDPDVKREDYAPADPRLHMIARKHNALWDAMTIQRNRQKLERTLGIALIKED